MKRRQEEYALFSGLIFTLVMLILCHCDKQSNLVDLQQKCALAKTLPEKQAIAERVESYYLQMKVSDSLMTRIEQKIKLNDIDPMDIQDLGDIKDWDNHNIYKLETQLNSRIKNLIRLRSESRPDESKEMINKLSWMSVAVDSLTNVRYWVPFVNRLKSLSPVQAKAWIKAHEAYLLCKQYHDKDIYWRDAEQYGAIGLQQLELFRDERLQLDIYHRLQFIIERFRSLHQLSLTMAEVFKVEAEKSGYYLRSASIQFHMAWTLHDQGEIAKSIEVNKALISFIQKYQNMPSIGWYRKESTNLLANQYWQLGEYENGLAICQAFLQQDLNPDQQYRIANIQALLYRAMGKYELAENIYNKALTVADSLNALNNKVTILNNLGYLFEQLTEYDRAISYYTKCKDLLEKSNPENLEDRANTMLNLISAKHKNSEQEGLEDLTEETIKIIEQLGNAPGRQTELWMSLGQIHMDLRNPQKALPYFEKAVAICDEKEMVHVGLETKIMLSQCMIQLEEYERATSLIEQVVTISKENNALERFIDAKALQAEIQFQKKNIDQAIAISNTLINKIDEISVIFENSQRLYAYRQKIYDYLKRAVYYEIKKNQLDLAYVKLTYAKQNTFGSNHLERNSKNALFSTNKAFIGQKDVYNSDHPLPIITLDYLLTDDSLFVFLIKKNDIRLAKKGINRAELARNVSALHSNILSTIEVLNDYQIEKMREHYHASKMLGINLYDELLGSLGIGAYLDSAKYLCVFADEFLYDIPFNALVVDTLDGVTYLAEKITVINNSPLVVDLQEKITFPQADIKHKKVLISADTEIPGVKELLSFLISFFSDASELIVEKEISKENVKNIFNQGYQIYIFIGHAKANNKYPELSVIEFMATNRATNVRQKISMSVADLKQCTWDSAEMIMLVGCETGSGKRYRSTGIASLQESLSTLGAKNVLGTLWEIDAGQATNHIKDFIQFWSETGDPALALRQTQQKALKYLSHHSFYKEPFPYLWSGYILSNNQNKRYQ